MWNCSGGYYLTGIERVLSVAKSDSRLQTIINNHLFKMGYVQHLVGGYLFKETKIDVFVEIGTCTYAGGIKF